MALDTRDKRASVLGLALGIALVLPNPDGAALDQGDRQQVAVSYRGIAAAAPAALEVYTIEVSGEYAPIIEVSGSFKPIIAVEGSFTPTIDVHGSLLDS